MFRDYFEIIESFIKVYGAVFLINVLLSLFIIFTEKRTPISTLLWVMAINFLPGLGFILYLIIGQDLSKRRMFKKNGRFEKKMRQIASTQLKMIKSGEKTLRDRTKNYIDVIELFNKGEDEILYSNNEIKKFNDGRDMFEELLIDIKSAKRSIYLQSYIFKSDTLSQKIMELLKEKAKEGLEVVLLVDGMGARSFKNRDRKLLKEAGVKVAVFFPGLFKTINTRINYRNHRKIIVIDSEIGYVGGLNVGDEYISLDKKFGFWRDTHLRIVGDAVRGLQYRFFLDYKYATSRTHGDLHPISPINRSYNFPNREVCIVTSGPDTKVNSIRSGYEKIITKARESIYIQTPYFCPDDGLLMALKTAALSGVDINIMMPRIKDHLFVHWASLSFLGELLNWGVNVYLYEGGFLHAKVLTCDDYLSSVGTANFDIRSFELNFEVNAFIFDEVITNSLINDFKEDVKKSHKLTLEEYRNRDLITKFREGISRLLSPLL